MFDPDVLLGLLVETLRDNPTLVTAIGGSALNITGYSQEYPTAVDMFSTVREMTQPAALVAWTETRIGNRSNGIEHFFSVFLRPAGKVAPVFMALREGVIANAGTKFKRTQIINDCHFPDVLGCFTRHLVIGDAVIEYNEVPIRLTQRGVDS